ncbi:trimethylamine methyltransferase family protein, partial [Deltaproteobacteria bacterium OttesenSCG-928-K17]|nr:trimethylamine methyltransferase family protein [Deltaproteobacteria bacterium OttesenSCG-928-K17]
ACMDKGEFLSSKLTIKSLRKEPRYVPSIMDWRQLPNWEENPDTIIDRAEAKVQEILKKSVKEPLLKEVQTELDNLMAAATKEFIG